MMLHYTALLIVVACALQGATGKRHCKSAAKRNAEPPTTGCKAAPECEQFRGEGVENREMNCGSQGNPRPCLQFTPKAAGEPRMPNLELCKYPPTENCQTSCNTYKGGGGLETCNTKPMSYYCTGDTKTFYCLCSVLLCK